MNIKEVRLKQIILEEIVDNFLEQIIEEELDKFLLENNVDLQAFKKERRRDLISKIKKGLLPLAVVGGLLAVLGNESSDLSDIKAAERATASASIEAEKQLSGYASEEVQSLLKSNAQFMWSLDSSVDKKSVSEPGVDFQKTVTARQHFPLFLDYMGGATQMFSGERGVLQKLHQDIQNQIAKGITMKSELKPGIELSTVRGPDISAEQYKSGYKEMYDMPDFNPAKVSKEEIGGNIDKMRSAALQISPKGGFDFIKLGGRSYGYETYQLLDTVNPELPNAGMSASQYYMQMFNQITGQKPAK